MDRWKGGAARPGLQSPSFEQGDRRLRAAKPFSSPCTVIAKGLPQSNATGIFIIRLRQDYSGGVRGPCGAIAYTRVSRHPRAGPRAVSRTGRALFRSGWLNNWIALLEQATLIA